ncbi:hypothetical protein LINPERPRIM_LOCUS25281 [Linum perenne]
MAQFTGPQPPMRVFTAIARRLWGYEGLVPISVLSENFYHIEFNLIQLCNWVLERAWHIHNSGLILRRWSKGISPVCFSPKETPEWIMYKKVPPVMLTNEGISWLSSKIGKPLNKFVREGTYVRVCLLRDMAVPCPASINIELEEGGDVIFIDIVSFQARDYKKDTSKQIWIAKEQKTQDASSSGKEMSGMVVQVAV